MKTSKLVDIFRQGNIVIPLFLLQHYQDFQLKLEEFVFLMYLYHCGGSFLFDPKKFGEDLNLPISDVMNYIDVLIEKKLIRVEVVKNDKGLMEETVLLDDFYNRLSFFMMDQANGTSNSEKSNIFEIIEKEFGRTLSPMEYEIIKAWLDNQMSEELILEAIKEATFNGVSNLRYIDKILYEWGKLGIKTVIDVEEHRKKRNQKLKEENNQDVDLELMDWNWFDEDE